MKSKKAITWTRENLSSINDTDTIMGMLYHKVAALEDKIPLEYLQRSTEDQKNPAANAIIALMSRIEDCMHEINDFQDALEELNT
jgi:hypothetical protein